MDKRAAGILMPITSLPSEYGIGCFSKSAYDFVDWLKEAGQSYWQILPLGPTSYGDSPYQSFSTFAGNPYFISLKALVEEGVLTKLQASPQSLRKQQHQRESGLSEICCRKQLVAFRLCTFYGSEGSVRRC